MVVRAGRVREGGFGAWRGVQLGRMVVRWGQSRLLMAALYEGVPRDLLRPDALALMRDARAAGLPVAVLTNDLHALHSQELVNRLGLAELAPTVPDGAVEGML